MRMYVSDYLCKCGRRLYQYSGLDPSLLNYCQQWDSGKV